MYFSDFYSDRCRLAAPRHHVCAHRHADGPACTPMTASMEVRHAG